MDKIAETLDVGKIRESSKLFQMLDETGQKALLELGVREKFPHDSVLFEEGNTGNTFYIVEAGTLRNGTSRALHGIDLDRTGSA